MFAMRRQTAGALSFEGATRLTNEPSSWLLSTNPHHGYDDACNLLGMMSSCLHSGQVPDLQGDVEARFTVGLPARGRSVLGDWAATVLTSNLPRCGQPLEFKH